MRKVSVSHRLYPIITSAAAQSVCVCVCVIMHIQFNLDIRVLRSLTKGGTWTSADVLETSLELSKRRSYSKNKKKKEISFFFFFFFRISLLESCVSIERERDD